ncbi:MAG: hypothetical protein FWH17_02510 [Oscillospiraceae bacterium]|nr:hypothetical protein [Oscillospiraceae bacterium]
MWEFIKSIFTGNAFDYLIDTIWPFIQSILETVFLAFLLVPLYLINIIQYVVGIFAGTRDIQVAGTAAGVASNTTFLEYFFYQPFVTRAFWGITLIAFALCLGFSIVAVLRSTGDLEQNRPLGKVIGSIGKAMLTFLLVPFMCISAILLVTIVMRQTEELFSGAAIYGEEVSVEGSMLISSVQPHHVRMYEDSEAYQLVNVSREYNHLWRDDPYWYAPVLKPQNEPSYIRLVERFGYDAIPIEPLKLIGFNPELHFAPGMGSPDPWDVTFGKNSNIDWEYSFSQLDQVEERFAGIGEGLLRLGTIDDFSAKARAQLEALLAAQPGGAKKTDVSMSWQFLQLVKNMQDLISPNVAPAEERESRWKEAALTEIAQMEEAAETAAAYAQSSLRAYEAIQEAYLAWEQENVWENYYGFGERLSAGQRAEQAELLEKVRDAEEIYNNAKTAEEDAQFVLAWVQWVLGSPRGEMPYHAADLRAYERRPLPHDPTSPGTRGNIAMKDARVNYEGYRYYIDARVAAEHWRLVSSEMDKGVQLYEDVIWYIEAVTGRGVRLAQVYVVMESYTDAEQKARYNELVQEYMFGRKGVEFRDMTQIRFDFNVFEMFFGGIGIFSIVAAWFMVIMLLMIVVVFIRRIFEVVVLYVVSPFFVSVMPLDDGKRFGGWRDMFISRLLAGFGSIFTLNIFLLMLPMIWSPNLILSNNTFVDTLLKLIFMAGGIYTVWKSHTLISTIINPQGAAAEQESAGALLGVGGMAMAVASGGANLAMGTHAGVKNSGSGDTGGGSGGSSGSGNKNPSLDGSSAPALPPPKPPRPSSPPPAKPPSL